jgi:hypothetical protein
MVFLTSAQAAALLAAGNRDGEAGAEEESGTFPRGPPPLVGCIKYYVVVEHVPAEQRPAAITVAAAAIDLLTSDDSISLSIGGFAPMQLRRARRVFIAVGSAEAVAALASLGGALDVEGPDNGGAGDGWALPIWVRV